MTYLFVKSPSRTFSNNNCVDYTIDFSDSSLFTDFYFWDFGVTGITTDTSSAKDPTFTFPDSGIYNLGSGVARTFLDLAKNTFKSMEVEQNISFIDTPEDIRDKYQYYTEANMQKLIDSGYDKGFTSLEDGVADYVKNHLIEEKYY